MLAITPGLWIWLGSNWTIVVLLNKNLSLLKTTSFVISHNLTLMSDITHQFCIIKPCFLCCRLMRLFYNFYNLVRNPIRNYNCSKMKIISSGTHSSFILRTIFKQIFFSNFIKKEKLLTIIFLKFYYRACVYN